jgi:chromosome segregation ATPase
MKPPLEPRSKREIKAELEELEPKISEAPDELDEAEANLWNLQEQRRQLRKELDPLLRPWERARAKAERKITAWVQVISG